MDITSPDLEKLKCFNCNNNLSQAPVYFSPGQGALCAQCYAPKCPTTRNIHYETLAKHFRFPCKNLELGCQESVPFLDEGKESTHEDACEYRKHLCPMFFSPAKCNWEGFERDVVQHCREEHDDEINGNPTILFHDIMRTNAQTYLLGAYDILFFVHTNVCLTSKKILYAVRYLETLDEGTSFEFTVKIDEIMASGHVVPQSCQTTQPTPLPLVTGNTLACCTLTIKRKLLYEVQCANCDAVVTNFRFRETRGWLCGRCAPSKRACRNQDCMYTDTQHKVAKHEEYFCQKSTRCEICSLPLPRGTLSSHYASMHLDTFSKGSTTWRATPTDALGVDRLLETTAGTAVCWYAFGEDYFVLWVYLEVPSERLREFECQVQVVNPTDGFMKRFRPDVEYKERFDWRIRIKKEEFKKWGELDVLVEIKRVV